MTSKLKTLLKSNVDVCFAYLFGSYANDTFDARSDIDIAVYFKNGIDLYDAGLTLHHSLEKALRKPVDLIVLNTIRNYDLLNDILNDGKVLIDREPDTRKIFEVEKEHEIKDYDVFKRMIDAA